MPASDPPPWRPAFSATDAAFAGLRIARREPMTILAWALMFLGVSVVTGGLMVVTIGPRLAELQALQPPLGSPPADPAKMMALMSTLAPGYALLLLLSAAFYGVLIAAVNRAVLKPAEGGFGRLRLGVDELLQLAVIFAVGTAVFLLYVGLVLVLVIIAALAVVANKVAGGALAVLGGAGIVAALLYVMVRLSLASPLALDQRRFDLKGAWRLTKGRFWPLLGAYVLAWLLALVLGLTLFVVFAAVAAMLGGGVSAAGTLLRPDMTSLAGYFTPVMALWLLAASGLNAVGWALMVGAPADAYRQLTGAATVNGGPGGGVVPLTPADRSTAFGTHP